MLFSMLFAALVFPVGKAFAQDSGWDAEKAVAEFHDMIDNGYSQQNVLDKQVGKRVQMWLSKIEQTKLDLGKDAYLVPIGKFVVADEKAPSSPQTEAAVHEFADYVIQKGQLPESAKKFAVFISNTMPQVASMYIEQGQISDAEKLLFAATSMSDRPEKIYAHIGTQLLDAQSIESHKLLTKFLAEALTNNKMSPRQKNKILAHIYNGSDKRATKAKDDHNASRFVPFEGPDLNGNKVAVSDFKGKLLLVDFWSSQCGPCMAEMPNLAAAYKKYKDQGFEILGVSLDRPNFQNQINNVTKKHDMDWPIIYDGKYFETEAAVLNKIQAIPTMYLLDRNGRPRRTDLRGDKLEKAIEELLAEDSQSIGDKLSIAAPKKLIFDKNE